MLAQVIIFGRERSGRVPWMMIDFAEASTENEEQQRELTQKEK
jgi:hypothetical protein